MRLFLPISLLLLGFITSFVYAMEINSVCQFCNSIHQEIDYEHDNNIIIDFIASESASVIFPCLAIQIKAINALQYLPELEPGASVDKEGIGKDQMLRLLYLSSIRAENTKMPITENNKYLWQNQLVIQDSSFILMEWLTFGAFVLLNAGASFSTFFSFITIYNTTDPNNPTVNNNASLFIECFLISVVVFCCAFLSNFTNFSWTEFSKRNSASRFLLEEDRSRSVDNDFKELSYALLLLSLDQPELSFTIANEIRENLVLERLPVHRAKWVANFFGIVDYIKSKGSRWPKSLKLQVLIKNVLALG